MEGYEKKRLVGKILMIVGPIVGVIAAILMIKWHPVLVGILGLGAAMYFIGQYLRKI